MQKTSITLVVITILTMLFSFLPPGTALAKAPVEVDLRIRNRTGGVVELKLVDANGNASWFRFEPGQTTVSLPEGIYSYYASTDCGNYSGILNLNVTKELMFFACGGDELGLMSWRPSYGTGTACGVYEWWHSWNGEEGHWHPGGPSEESDGEWDLRCADGVVIQEPN